jgi:hypothetical protein
MDLRDPHGASLRLQLHADPVNVTPLLAPVR